MSAIKTFFKQFSWLAVAEAWGKVVIFILLTLVAHLGTEQLGVYSYVLSIMGIFSILSDFGTTGIYIREAKKDPAQSGSVFVQFFFLKIAIVACFAVGSSIWLLATHSNPDEWWYFLLYGVFVMFDTFTMLCLAHLRTQELFSYEAGVKIISRVVLLIVLGIAALCGVLDLFTVFLAYAIAGFFAFIAAGISVLPTIVRRVIDGSYRPRLRAMKEAFAASFPLGLSTVFWQIYYRIDTVILKKIKGDAVTGYYSAAYGLLQLINVFPALAMVVLFPKFADQFHHDRAQYRKQFRAAVMLFLGGGVVVAFCTALIAPIIPYYFGAEYSDSVHILRVLAWAIPILYVNHVLANNLVVIKKASTLTVISFVGIIVNVTLNVITIPTYGAVAAAWNTAFTEYSVCILFTLALRNAYKKMYA